MRAPETDPRYEPSHYGERAARVREVLAYPLIDSHGELKAVLELVNRTGAPAFRKDDEVELAPYCRLAGITLHNSRTLSVARRTADGALQTKLERRNSMLGVRRSSMDDAPLPYSDEQHGDDARSASPKVELGLLSQRKIRASVV